MYILGQALGICSTIVTLIQPQFRRRTQILVCGILVNILTALNFLLIGHFGSAVTMSVIAVAQGLLAIRHENRGTQASRGETIVFTVLFIIAGIYGLITSEGFVWGLTKHNLVELLPIAGALVLMFAVFAHGEQRTRWLLLVNGIVWLIYSAIIGASSVLTMVFAVVSTGVALVRYYTTQGSGLGDTVDDIVEDLVEEIVEEIVEEAAEEIVEAALEDELDSRD